MGETAITAQQAFEQKVRDRLRESIGDLMPDEVLSGMVSKVLEDSLLKPRMLPNPKYKAHDTWCREPETALGPPLLQEIVTELLKPRVIELVAAQLAEIRPALEEQIEGVIRKGVFEVAAEFQNQKIAEAVKATLRTTLSMIFPEKSGMVV